MYSCNHLNKKEWGIWYFPHVTKKLGIKLINTNLMQISKHFFINGRVRG